MRSCSCEPRQITPVETLCNWKFCTNTTSCSNLSQPPHLACCPVAICCLMLLFRCLSSPLWVGNPPELGEARQEGFWVCRPGVGKLQPGCAEPGQSRGAPRSQETPGQALTGRGVPCLHKADEISFTPRNKQVGGGGEGGGCDRLKRAENGFGSWWLADWQRTGGGGWGEWGRRRLCFCRDGDFPKL